MSYDPFAKTYPASAEASSQTPPPAVQAVADSETPKLFYTRQEALVKSRLAEFDRQIDDLVAKISALEVSSPETEHLALNLGQTCDKVLKALESSRKAAVEEPNAFVKSVNSVAKHYQEKLNVGLRTSKDKLNVYMAQKAVEVQKAAEAERRARAEMQAKLDAEAARLTAEAKAKNEAAEAITAPKLPDAPPATVPKTVRSAEGSATMVKSWTFEVTDPAAVPREYLVVDEKALRAAVKDGIREIPGVRIFEDSNIRFGR
jgi:uncharacterized membrane protein YqiK